MPSKPFERTREPSSDKVRKTTLTFRVNDIERRIIEDRAKECNKSVSDYLRQTVLSKVPRAALTDEERDIMKACISLKFNLQQINNYFHSHQWDNVREENIKIINVLKRIMHL